MRPHDTTHPRVPRKYKNATPNTFEIDEETGAALIPLGGKKFPGRFALVDVADAPLVAPFSWRPVKVTSRGDRDLLYVSSRIPDLGYVYMHRFILGLSDRKTRADHINHDTLDNRRSNIRVVSHQQNIFNRRPNLHASSQFKGVSWWKAQKRWAATIRVDNRRIFLGYFDDEVDAAFAYDEAARRYFGHYAYLNFPDEGEVAS